MMHLIRPDCVVYICCGVIWMNDGDVLEKIPRNILRDGLEG